MKVGIKNSINSFLKAFGFEISRTQHLETHLNEYALGYISARETIDAASKAGLSVSDYLEMIWNQKGNGQTVVNNIKEFGVFNRKIKHICEIGTGAGLYAEKVIKICKPEYYESYETDRDWAEWLTKKYNIISHNADGKSLSYTRDSSIELVLANGVFVYLPFLTSYRYIQEIVRVSSNNGYVIFDILSEDCFDEKSLQSWIASNNNYPCFLCQNYIVDFFTKHNFSLVGEFFNYNFGSGKSKYLIFKRGY